MATVSFFLVLISNELWSLRLAKTLMPFPRIRILFLPLLMLATLIAQGAQAEWYSETASKMGTRIEVQLWHDDSGEAQRLIDLAMAEFDRIEAAMSTYRASSELSRVNATAADAPVVVSAELFDLLKISLDLSQRTNGAFDITYDSVGELYDYRAGVRPSTDAIDEHLGAVNFRHVQLDAKQRTVKFAVKGVRVNLGGIAKGYSVERAIAILRENGVHHGLASAGGDTRILGDRRNAPWVVGIRDPDNEEGIVTRLALIDEAVSTSGDYERFFEEDGKRYHHILDPSSGMPASGLRGVTVIGPDATLTDGLSTSLFVLGWERGLAVIESFPGYEAVILQDDHGLRYSSGLDPG
jgi:thiamine biosynthesis lipoprotein